MCIVTGKMAVCPPPHGTNTVSSWLCLRLSLVVVDLWHVEPAYRGAGKHPCYCGFGIIDDSLHWWSQWYKTNITSIIISDTSDFPISECKTQPSFCTPFSNVTGPVWRFWSVLEWVFWSEKQVLNCMWRILYGIPYSNMQFSSWTGQDEKEREIISAWWIICTEEFFQSIHLLFYLRHIDDAFAVLWYLCTFTISIHLSPAEGLWPPIWMHVKASFSQESVSNFACFLAFVGIELNLCFWRKFQRASINPRIQCFREWMRHEWTGHG